MMYVAELRIREKLTLCEMSKNGKDVGQVLYIV